LDEVVAAIEKNWARIHSLSVEYTAKAEPLERLEAIKKYLHIEYLIQEERFFAFKGTKQYYRELGPRLVDRIAPDTEPDYDALPGGRERKRLLDENRALAGVDEKTLKKMRTSRQIQLDPEKITAFDGKVLRRLHSGGRTADVESAEMVPKGATWFVQDYVRSLGLRIPDGLESSSSRKQECLPDVFRLGPYSVEPALQLVNGFACVVVAWPGRDKLWLDPKVGFALRRRELLDPEGGSLMERWHNHDFVEGDRGIWLPKVCHVDRCGSRLAPAAYRGKPLLRYVFTVTKLGLNNVPDSLFTLDFRPGTFVADANILPAKEGEGDFVTYVIPADRSKLDEAVQEAIAQRAQFQGRRWWTSAFVWGTTIIVVACLGLLLVLRRLPWQKRAG
jgi:hypothetical protein